LPTGSGTVKENLPKESVNDESLKISPITLTQTFLRAKELEESLTTPESVSFAEKAVEQARAKKSRNRKDTRILDSGDCLRTKLLKNKLSLLR
jgi:hypothetical protein